MAPTSQEKSSWPGNEPGGRLRCDETNATLAIVPARKHRAADSERHDGVSDRRRLLEAQLFHPQLLKRQQTDRSDVELVRSQLFLRK
jgi:hypothetical protein